MSADADPNREPPGDLQRIQSGIDPVDRRLGGLTPGGLYLVSGGAVDTRHYLSLLYLRAGLRSGGTAALLTQVPRDHLLRRLRQWKLTEVSAAWEEGRLRVSGYRGGYEHRVRNAGDPGAVFDELERRTGGDAGRVALVPGRPLWRGALGPVMTEAFMEWARRTPATVWATCQWSEGGSSDDERLHHAAAGVFELVEDGRGETVLRVRKTAAADLEPSTLPLGESLAEIAGDDGDEPPTVVLMRAAGSDVGDSLATIRGWLREVAVPRELDDPADLVDVLQEDSEVDAVVVCARQDGLEEAVSSCRLADSVGRAPVVAVIEGRVRAADHARLIRAGADECLSGPINLPEFATRLERLVPGEGRLTDAATSDQAPEESESGEDETGGVVSEGTFRRRLRRSLARRPPDVFTVVRLPRESLPGEPERRLSEAVRLEDGDFVGAVAESVAVYLRGTSPDEAEAFLTRLTAEEADLEEAELLGSVRDAGELRRLAGDD